MKALLVAAVATICLPGAFSSQDPPSPEALIEKLGSDAPADRDAAMEGLRKLAAKAVPPLKQALKSAQDLEVKTRIEILLSELEILDPAEFFSCRRAGSPRANGEAVLAALRWLARHQSPDGGWGAEGFAAQCAETKCEGAGERDYDVGLTGLALLAFLGAGYTQDSKDEFPDPLKKDRTLKFGAVVLSGLKRLISQQDRDGCLGERGMKYNYNHAVGTLALAEAFGMTRADFLKAPAQKAADFLVAGQNPGKGWRYSARCGDNDTSATAWATMALRVAEVSSLQVPKKTFDGALAWFDEATEQTGYYAVGYNARGTGKVFIPGRNEQFDHHATMSAAAITSRLFIRRRKTEVDLGAVNLLPADLPQWKENAVDAYYWYFGSLAVFQYDGAEGRIWKRWNEALVRALVPTQRTVQDGCQAGSWSSTGDRWGAEGGRVYTTAINALSLEVPTRYPVVAVKK